MPPRSRKPQRTEPSSSLSPSVLSQEQEDEQESRPTFFNTTFSLHRVSPLYVGAQPLDRQRLQLLSQRLSEVLVGDVVRGVEVGLALGRQEGEEGGGMGRAGALEYVDARWVNMGSILDITEHEPRDSEEEQEEEDEYGRQELGWSALIEKLRGRKALHILLRYEMAECIALLFPSASSFSSSAAGDDDDDEAQPPATEFTVSGTRQSKPANPSHFAHLPLLLLRMPAPLKAVTTDFLSTTFDCRISSLRLGTRSLVQSWESWVRTAGILGGAVGKDVVLSLGFYIPPPDTDTSNANASGATGEDIGQEPLGIKAIDVIIPATDLRQFIQAGKQMTPHLEKEKGRNENKEKPTWETTPTKRRKLAGRLGEEGWEWRSLPPTSGVDNTEPEQKSSFTEALGKYVDKHLGLNLFHPGVRVTKIACGGFAMSEGRMKIFTPREGERRKRAGVWKLVEGLVGKAEGRGREGLV